MGSRDSESIHRQCLRSKSIYTGISQPYRKAVKRSFPFKWGANHRASAFCPNFSQREYVRRHKSPNRQINLLRKYSLLSLVELCKYPALHPRSPLNNEDPTFRLWLPAPQVAAGLVEFEGRNATMYNRSVVHATFVSSPAMAMVQSLHGWMAQITRKQKLRG